MTGRASQTVSAKALHLPAVTLPADSPTERHGHATSTGAGKDLSNLDVLRTVAVLSVVISHTVAAADPKLPFHRYGSFGVALFFVHTSLVLMWSLERRPNTVDFYIRRAARIYPLAILSVFAVLLFHAPVAVGRLGGDYFVYARLTVVQIVEHLLLVQNLFSGNKLLYVMWSLPLEVQMYLLLPMLFFFVRQNRRLWPLLIFWAVVWCFCSKEFNGVDLNLVFAGCYFLPGVMAFVGFSRWKPRLPGWMFPPFLLLVGAIGGNAPNWRWAAPPALALGLALPLFRQVQFRPLARGCWYAARYSYGVYLLHPFCLVFAFYFGHSLPLAVQLGILVSSIVVLSVAAYHLVEAPWIRLGGKFANRVSA